MKRLFVIAGETSGDTHGAGLLTALRERMPEIEIHGLGGPKLHALAGETVEDWLDQAAVVGVTEVLRNYGFFRRKFHEQLVRITALQPDAVLLIDYPGFNLRLAKALRASQPRLKILYYISPQVWAWNRGRIPKMARWLDLMICIFPFEAALYNASGLKTVFGGHPIADCLGPRRLGLPREADLVALLPGSRHREIASLFPDMIEAARRLQTTHPMLHFAAAAASEKLAAQMRAVAGEFPCAITVGNAHELMQRAAAGLVASGTATLEAAFFGLPYALVYRVSWLTYLAGRALIKIRFLGIVNILANREVVREFIQRDANPEALATELVRLLDDSVARDQLQRDLAAVIAGLNSGGAYARAASLVAEALRQ